MHARHPSGVAGERTGLDIADIFRRHLDTYRHSHVLVPAKQAVVRDLLACRTAALGGHLEVCTSCGFERPAYNSCRNRHCPRCQALNQARWVEARLERILPVHYFHLVFTLPSELRDLCRQNRPALFDLLLKTTGAVLATLAADPKWLGHGAQLGVTAVLHTWTRDLLFHPHVHCIVTGGGLAQDQSRWVAAPPDFLFPVRVLGALFRGKFLAALEDLFREGKLRDDADGRAARRRRARLHKQSWIVYAKRPFGGPEQVYRYLGRYTHRVAISNSRLVSVGDHAVVFRTRGQDTATVTPTEFIGRFLEHLLPKGFVKIRHFGLLASGNVNGRLERARALLPTFCPKTDLIDADHVDHHPAQVGHERLDPDLPWLVLILALTGQDLALCPMCHQRTMVRQPLPAARAPPRIASAPVLAHDFPSGPLPPLSRPRPRPSRRR